MRQPSCLLSGEWGLLGIGVLDGDAHSWFNGTFEFICKRIYLTRV